MKNTLQVATPFTWGEIDELPTSAWLGHIPFARWLVETVRPTQIVELGTHRGASFFAFCQAMAEQGIDGDVHAVDTWEGDAHAGFYGDAVYLAVEETTRKRYPSIGKLHRCTFDEARADFGPGSVDILHIDGLHTYDAVRHDYENWHATVRNGGLILFHDICEKSDDFGVWKLWDELKAEYPTFEFHHSHGLGVLGVGAGFPSKVAELFALDLGGKSHRTVRQQFQLPGQRLELLQEREMLKQQIGHLGTELAGLKNSRSWKLTSPLREMEAGLRKLVRQNKPPRDPE